MPFSFQEGLPLDMVKQLKGGDYAEESVQSSLNNVEVTLGRKENIQTVKAINKRHMGHQRGQPESKAQESGNKMCFR